MKAAAYARYSTDNQTDNSIAYQMNSIQKYCNDHKITICAFFADEAKSGTNEDREGFQNMVAAANRKEFDAVVIYDITRGSRDVADWFNFRKDMMRLGIEVISATQHLGDITNPNDFLTELISVGLGQHAILDTRKKSIAGVAERAKQGVFLGGVAPLGYDIVKGQYIINETEAKAVRTIFKMYSNGKSYNQILDALHDRGKRGQPLGKNSIPSILSNERYIGVYTWNKRKMKLMRKWAGGKPNPECVRIENAIPAIIERDLWEGVQTRLNSSRRNATNKAKREYLLAGLIECADCGATYVGHCSTNAKGYGTRYYVCGNKYRTRTCPAKNINADSIETFVVQHLKAYLLEADFTEVACTIADAVNSAAPDLSKERQELSEINLKITNGVKAILSGVEFPELEDEVNRLRIRKSELEDIIAHSESHRGRQLDPAKIVDLFRYSVEHFDDEHLKEIINFHITKIYANTDGSFTVNVGVHLTGCGGRI
ncbi:recombinase family protein [Caproiciproducens faecalis]|uniref:Recombinase family protein n=1 Tax=Caproiciproducens faecalis TaxID=2820301 RepID=A0ABS7DM91_9FIRM|nr:recombinase family protein [Caproiciproducens faecalis]MBW7572424.1 recombinase family protein [Caproiciproducens faecalis]